MKILYLILLCSCSLAPLKAQWVITVAGVLENAGNNDGPALSAQFNNPHGVAVDAEGMAYIADRYNHTIRKYNPETSQVTTLAGQPGQSGALDGIGNQASFNEPWGICVTPDGTVYVADTKNNKIRKVMPDGTVSTVAGTGNFGTTNGPAINATFGNPTGIEVDPNGNIYVADHLTHIIRKINSMGDVSNLAGDPYMPGDVDGFGDQAQFWRPYGLTLDHQGNILVADEWNHKIRRVTPAGEVTTVSGTGDIGLVNGTAANAQFHYPWDMTVDEEGNIYVADGFNYVIRRIGIDGLVTSLAGMPLTTGGSDGLGPNASFSGATGVAYSEKYGTIYIADAYNHMVRVLYIDTQPDFNVWLVNLSGDTSFCEGGFAKFQANPIGYPKYSFYVDGTLKQEGITAQFSMTNLQAGNYVVNMAANTEDGETITSNSINISVTAPPAPTIQVVGPLSFYEGDSVILIANGTGDFLWSDGSPEQAITVYESGTYFVEEEINGCFGISATVVVDVTPLPNDVVITLEGNPVLCPGETVRLISSSATGNKWLKDGWVLTGQTAPFIDVSETGIYQVQVTDAATGVTVISTTQEVIVAPTTDYNFAAAPRQGPPGQEVRFISSGVDAPLVYAWDFGDFNGPNNNTSSSASPAHVYEEEGSYTVVLYATDSYGCEVTISKTDFIQIKEGGSAGEEIFLPSAFTPNGDGENDVFRVLGPVSGEFLMNVFNHWGELIFSSTDPAFGWDGTRKGLPVHSGTFVYLVETGTINGTKQMTGYVTLLR